MSEPRNIWSHIHNLLIQDQPCVLVSIIDIHGSTPRDVGARMVIKSNGDFYGTIGGGALEMKAIKKAQKMLSQPGPQVHRKEYILGPDIGQCCGGSIDLLTEAFTQNSVDQISQLKEWESDGIFTTYSHITNERVVRSLNDDDNSSDFIESFGELRYALFIFGAGHVGHALLNSLTDLPFDVTWIDSRPDVFPTTLPANFKPINCDKPHKLIPTAPDCAYILVLTHDHDMDLEITEAAIRENRFAYIGLIGSKTKAARFRSRFKQAGLSPTEIATMTSPIGINTIKSKNPSAIAISVAADLLTRIEDDQ